MPGIQSRGRTRNNTNKIERVKTQNKVIATQPRSTRYQPRPSSGKLDQSTQNKIQSTDSNIAQAVRAKKVKHMVKLRTSDDPASRIMLGIGNTGSDYANILNSEYEDKSILNQAIGHAFEGNWDKAGQVIQENPYRFTGNLLVEAGSALIPVGAVLKAAKAGKIVSKVANKTEGLVAKAVNKAIPVDNKYVKKFIDLEQPKKLTPEQWKSFDESRRLGDQPIHPLAFKGSTTYDIIKINIKSKVTNFRNRNKIIKLYNPLHINVKNPLPPDAKAFVSTKSRELVEINPLSFHGSDDDIIRQFADLNTHEVLFHKAVPDAIAGKNIVTPKAATASLQGDNIAYLSPDFQSRTINKLNKGESGFDNTLPNLVLGPQAPARLGPRSPSTVQQHIIQTISDMGLSGVGPKGSVVRTRQHNVKGIDAIGGFTKEAESATTFKRGNFDHHDDVVRVRQAFSIAREAGEVRGFADEKKTLKKLYKNRWKEDFGSSVYNPYMTASEKKKAKWFRNKLIPYQLKQITKEEKKIKRLNYISKTPNPVPFSAKLIEKNEEKLSYHT
jgi:hypothetical protein